MKPVSYDQRDGGHRKDFVPRSPTGSFSVSSWLPKPPHSPLPGNPTHHNFLLGSVLQTSMSDGSELTSDMK